MKLQWKKGARGREDRETECGTYRVVHMSSEWGRMWWGATLAQDPGKPPVYLDKDGQEWSRSPWSREREPEGSISDAKGWCQMHADRFPG